MLRIRLIIIGVLFCLITYGQTLPIKGVINKKSTKEGLPYVSIGIKNSTKGTSSDTFGNFEIEVSETDTLIFTSVGFKPLVTPVINLQSVIYLEEDVISLSEVTIKSKRYSKSALIGNTKRKTFLSLGGSNQYAMLLKNEMNSESIIERLFFELQPDTDKKSKWKTAFKIRVYQNNNGVPGHDLILENIVLSADKNSKLLSVDVSKYSLVLPTNGVFIGVDFIGYFDNEDNFIPYSTSKRPLNLRITFTNQDTSNTYSKFFGTKWRLVTHKKMNGEVTNINAKFGAKISY